MAHISESRFRVRYAETDQMGMVYYANYFVWMEIGRTDFCRDCGFSYRELEREEQAFLTVAEANCRYLAPARYDDEIIVETELARVKAAWSSFRTGSSRVRHSWPKAAHFMSSSGPTENHDRCPTGFWIC